MSLQYMINCFSHISTEENACHYWETRSRSNVSGAYTCWKTSIKLTFSMERLYWLTEGWYQNISLLPVPCANSLNSLLEALLYIYIYILIVNAWHFSSCQRGLFCIKNVFFLHTCSCNTCYSLMVIISYITHHWTDCGLSVDDMGVVEVYY